MGSIGNGQPSDKVPSAPTDKLIPELLTVIITTSPTPSAPSTDLLSAVFSSFQRHCGALLHCRVIVVFDTYECITQDIVRLKKGHVTPELAEKYHVYKDRAKALVLREYGITTEKPSFTHRQMICEFGLQVSNMFFPVDVASTQDGKVTFIQPQTRLGFALAVRSALRVTETPYVWVHQHDWQLMVDIPLGPFLEIMQAHDASETAPIRYLCLPGGRMLSHEETNHVNRFPALRDIMIAHRGDFSPASQPDVKIPLTPLFFWHDKPHIASTAHYLARIFPSRLAVPRGAFIEDTVGHRARQQMKEGIWAKWACWLYYPNRGLTSCVGHLKGRTWRGVKSAAEYRAAGLARSAELQKLKAMSDLSLEDSSGDADSISELEEKATIGAVELATSSLEP